ncbi:MAG: ATP-binding protein [Erysipelotrichaceae bacterium]
MIDRPLYVNRIMAYTDTPFVKILTGVRRAGKSTVLKMIIDKLKNERNIKDEQIVSFRYDSMEFNDMTAEQMYTQLKGCLCENNRTYLFLNEAQEIEGWEKVVNSIMSDFDVDIYITGSNSRMMSSEISTYLTGRYVSFHIYTLSFGEYLFFRSSFTSVSDTRTELANYVRLGGFPAAHLRDFSQDEIYTIIKDI